MKVCMNCKVVVSDDKESCPECGNKDFQLLLFAQEDIDNLNFLGRYLEVK